jgi:hypothetical protein
MEERFTRTNIEPRIALKWQYFASVFADVGRKFLLELRKLRNRGGIRQRHAARAEMPRCRPLAVDEQLF